ncbi:MAG: alpha/beta hydrolase [Desulfobulbus propionicus]|nr:MAG: alpha/beta hydrolase [Desulfobulbus propionicus]
MKTPLAEYPYTPKYFDTPAGKLAYLDEGQGHPVVCVHGNPSWSYLYRNVIKELKGDYRCVAPDHMGCGFSDKPAEYPYTLHNHITNLEALLDHLEIQECTLMVHDWGGAIGMGWAGRYPERVKGLVVLNTAAFRSSRIPFRISICRWPIIGDLLVRGLNGFAGAAIFMAVTQKMRDSVAQGFLAPYDSWKNRIAILRFVQDIPLDQNHPSWNTLVQVEQGLEQLQNHPMLICWGGKDFCFNEHFYAEWQQRFPHAEANYFEHGNHYVLEDELPAIVPLLKRFLKKEA